MKSQIDIEDFNTENMIPFQKYDITLYLQPNSLSNKDKIELILKSLEEQIK